MIQNRKGITPIISVILLLMMTIAIAGLAYTWLQRMQTSVQTTSENASETILGGMKVHLSIDGYFANCSGTTHNVTLTVYVKNGGTHIAKNLQLYIDDALQSGASQTGLAAGNRTTFNTTLPCSGYINKTHVFKVTSDETSAERTLTLRCSVGSESNC